MRHFHFGQIASLGKNYFLPIISGAALALTGLLAVAPLASTAYAATENVSNSTELEAALADSDTDIINITADMTVDGTLVLSRSEVTINGNNHTITFTGDSVGWSGNYILQVYKATEVAIIDLKLTGGDAALLVNGSEVRLIGTIDVSGNEFGGIEVSKGAGVTTEPVLTLVPDMTLLNSTETDVQPTIWTDGYTGEDYVLDIDGITRSEVVDGKDQRFYFLYTPATFTAITLNTATVCEAALPFSVMINGNDDVATLVRARITLTEGNTENLTLQYEESTEEFITLDFDSNDQTFFGPSTGFPIQATATSNFTVDFDTAGAYTFLVELVDVQNDTVVGGSLTHTVTVTNCTEVTPTPSITPEVTPTPTGAVLGVTPTPSPTGNGGAVLAATNQLPATGGFTAAFALAGGAISLAGFSLEAWRRRK